METEATATAPAGSAHALEPTRGPLLREELQLAFRNRGMPLEAMRYDITPTGLHYLVVHWDIPAADDATWRLSLRGAVRNALRTRHRRRSARGLAGRSRSRSSAPATAAAGSALAR